MPICRYADRTGPEHGDWPDQVHDLHRLWVMTQIDDYPDRADERNQQRDPGQDDEPGRHSYMYSSFGQLLQKATAVVRRDSFSCDYAWQPSGPARRCCSCTDCSPCGYNYRRHKGEAISTAQRPSGEGDATNTRGGYDRFTGRAVGIPSLGAHRVQGTDSGNARPPAPRDGTGRQRQPLQRSGHAGSEARVGTPSLRVNLQP